MVGDLTAIGAFDFALDANEEGPVGTFANIIYPVGAIDLTGVSATDYLVFYSEYMFADDGFGEWKRTPNPIPEPSSALLFAVGGTIVGGSIRRFKRAG